MARRLATLDNMVRIVQLVRDRPPGPVASDLAEWSAETPFGRGGVGTV
jgi:hypothetical protein